MKIENPALTNAESLEARERQRLRYARQADERRLNLKLEMTTDEYKYLKDKYYLQLSKLKKQKGVALRKLEELEDLRKLANRKQYAEKIEKKAKADKIEKSKLSRYDDLI